MRSLEEILRTYKEKGENLQLGCERQCGVNEGEVGHRTWWGEGRSATQLARRAKGKEAGQGP